MNFVKGKVQKAVDVIGDEYWKFVTKLTKELVEAIQNGEIFQEGLGDRLVEEADNAVTYTFDAQVMLIGSDNDEAYLEHYDDDTVVSVEARAAAALDADIHERLNNKFTMQELAGVDNVDELFEDAD